LPATRIDVPTAHAALQNEKGAVYLDVRTEEEFSAGHPEGAINIPIGVTDPVHQRLQANPEFLEVVRAVLPRETPVITGCRSGPRAEMAAHMLSESGYSNVRWVLGGFHGMTDATGRVVAPGWLELGLPRSSDTGEGVGYQSLRKKAASRG
jgi:rhodanese-related sulfurtransferase